MYRTITTIFIILVILYIPIFPFGFWFNPPTGSMQPQLEGCDILLYGPGNPEISDVMMYWDDDDTIIMHRIIEEKQNGYVFKGDNIPEPDDGLVRDKEITAELYFNLDLQIDRDTCTEIFKRPYNTYYDLTGSSRTLSSSSVKNV
jgi:signal peptidase I